MAREITFSSFLGTVLTLLGVAVGLGNVWRFPYMMGSYGGSAFLALYVALMILVAVPALMAELALARHYRGATITVLRRSFGSAGRWLGYLLVTGVFIAGSYYTLVVGHVFYSAWFVVVHGFDASNIAGFSAGLTSAGLQYGVALAVLWTSLWVIDRGLKRGIERVSGIVVPLFFVLIVYLAYVALRQPGAMAALVEFMRPDFARIGIQELFAALGQCFFSAGLGATFILVYGKFLRADTALAGAAGVTAGGDILASILAAMIIVPSVAVFGLELSSGPRLLFQTLPALLAQMPAGRLVGSLLLPGLALVAFLSVVAVFQVVLVSLEEEPLGRRLGRRRLLLLAGVTESLLIIYPGWVPAAIAPMDLIFGSGFMVAGGVCAVVAVTWSMARHDAYRELFGEGRRGLARTALFLWLRWAIPVTLATILVSTVYGALAV